MSDLSVDDDVQDASDEAGKVLEERKQANLDNEFQVAQPIANRLGPYSDTADQSYMSCLAALKIGKLKKKDKKETWKGAQINDGEDETEDMEVSQTNNQQPPAPPGAGAAPIIIRGGNCKQPAQMKTKFTKPGIITKGVCKKKNPNDEVAIEPGDPPPGPPSLPAGTAAPKWVKKTRITKPAVLQTFRIARARSAGARVDTAATTPITETKEHAAIVAPPEQKVKPSRAPAKPNKALAS